MDDEKTLVFIREEIDSIDAEIIALLESRFNLTREIGRIKRSLDKALFDEGREEEILKKIDELTLIYPKDDLKEIFKSIMKTSLNQQKLMNKILIIGGGFMGYSLSLALTARGDNPEISIVEPSIDNQTLIQNKPTKFTLYDDLEKVTGDFDFVIICTPIKQIPKLIMKAADIFKQDCNHRYFKL